MLSLWERLPAIAPRPRMNGMHAGQKAHTLHTGKAMRVGAGAAMGCWINTSHFIHQAAGLAA